MALSWTDITAGDLIKADHWNEIKNNIDATITKVDMPSYS